MLAARHARDAGFTTTEMLVVVAIVALLAALAAPNMGTMIRSQRIKTAAFDVFSSLTYARSEAIKRNTTVTVTPAGGDWTRGWRVADSNGNVLRDQSGWDALTAVGPTSVTFAGTGRASAPSQISLSASGVGTAQQRCVKLDLSGRATTVEGSC